MVRLDQQGPVALVVIDRPDRRNAVDGPTAAALAAAVRQAETLDGVRVGVLTGAGSSFCAGADLKALAGPDANRIDPLGDGPMGPTRSVPRIPFIAAIEGFAVAGGLELALWCDLRVAARDATLGVFCRRWGVPLIDGGTVRLPRLIGLGRALDLILTGRPVGADEALQMGLVSRVVEPGGAREAAMTLAAELAAFPNACLRADREAVYGGLGLAEADALQAELASASRIVLAEALNGADAFWRGAGRGGSPR